MGAPGQERICANDASKSQPEPSETYAESFEDLNDGITYVLGTGSIGLLVAHSLRRLEQSPRICLLLHRTDLVESFQPKNTICLLNKETGQTDRQSGYSFESLESGLQNDVPFWRRFHARHTMHSQEGLIPEREWPIRSLVVACKAPATVSALQSVKHRISAETTICLMQNGMGQVEELNKRVFEDPATRPTYMLGIVTHGLYVSEPFTAVHAGIGKISIGILRDMQEPQATIDQPKPSSKHLLRILNQAPSLNCTVFDYAELLQLQFEKLAVNCIVNPLTALIDIHNGGILENDPLSDVQRALITEISKVIQVLPEMRGLERLRTRFSLENLTERFIYMTKLTAHNSSSMREDVRAKRDTEIEYVNGYIVKRGKEVGVECVANTLVMQLVKGKTIASRTERIS